MADLLGGNGGPPTTGGDPGASIRPTAPPIQTGSPLSGIRGPRMILREREERAARREREQLERDRAAQEARTQEETQRRAAAERRAAAAAGAASAAGAVPGMSGEPPSQASADPATAQRRRRQSQQADSQGRTGDPSARARPSGQQQEAERRPAAAPQATQYPSIPTRTAAPAGAPGGQASAAAAAAGGSRNRTSFPHAFERWEALSAHWEGMISYWIHKLEERKDDIDSDSINRQLAQQVADLSAAGANLFHAVVNLQKLRASSERKFQRWFFETRAELERSQEVTSMMEATLLDERRKHENAIRDAVEKAVEKATRGQPKTEKTEKALLEMRKELFISKDEARRAWEELGRREQEERERTLSLQQGRPTIVGGVQVVPMSQGVPSRMGSERRRRDDQAEPEYEAAQQQEYQADYSQDPEGATMAATAGPSTSAYYSQPETTTTAGHARHGSYGAGSEGTYSDAEYAIAPDGSFVRDSQGNRVPFRSPSPSNERRQGGTSGGGEEEYHQHSAVTYAPQPPTSSTSVSYPPSASQSAQYTGDYPAAPAPPQQDYSGQGYAAPGWETLPRHHHPTRLSDVLEEEEERSRASGPSQASRA